MTPIEIIDETVEFYKENARAVDGGCFYLYENGAKCAVGRCFTDEVIAKQQKEADSRDEEKYRFRSIHGINFCFSIAVMNSNNPEDLLKPEYKGQTIEFWRQLQHLHDSPIFWSTENGKNVLTARGTQYLTLLKDRFKEST
jgi:hypothetical protein